MSHILPLGSNDDDEVAVASGPSSSPSSVTPLPSDSDAFEDTDTDDYDDEIFLSPEGTDEENSDGNESNWLTWDWESALLWLASTSANEDNSPPPQSSSSEGELENGNDENDADIHDDENSPERRVRRMPSYLHYRHELPREVPIPEDEVEQEEHAALNPFQPEQGIGNILLMQPDDFSVFKNAVYYMSVPAAVFAIPVAMSMIFYWVIMPMKAFSATELSVIFISFLCVLYPCFHSFVTRPDFQVNGLSPANLEKQIMQLLAISFVFPFLLWTQLFRKLNTFHAPSSWQNWLLICLQYFSQSFTLLFTLDIPLSFHRMTKSNPLFGEILAFELVAHLLPAAYIAAPFLLMDLFATTLIPPAWQSLGLWGFLHFATFSWIALIFVGMAKYPEITTQRSHGVMGFVLMGSVTMLQGLLTAVFVIFLRLSYYVCSYMGNVGEINYFGERAGPLRYVRQIQYNIPPVNWEYKYPYPITAGFWTVLFCVVCQLRTLNLTLILLHYDERIANGHVL